MFALPYPIAWEKSPNINPIPNGADGPCRCQSHRDLHPCHGKRYFGGGKPAWPPAWRRFL